MHKKYKQIHITKHPWVQGVQGWCSDESTRLPPMSPGFDSYVWRHMWAGFVGAVLCTKMFSPGTLASPLFKKPAFDLICVNC